MHEPNISKTDLEKVVRQLITEQLANQSNNKDGLVALNLPIINVTEDDRLDTGIATDHVYTKDLLTLSESPRLGCGLMVMEQTTFKWHLDYDEIDYVIEGELSVIGPHETVTAKAGEVIFIPKGSQIQFSVAEKARFLYVTYPADWNSK